jgi:sugar-specific transcriptional regulator TrmB
MTSVLSQYKIFLGQLVITNLIRKDEQNNRQVNCFEITRLPIAVEDVGFLSELGFTKNQAILYLALLKLEEADVRRLFEKTNIPRSEVYRVLKELQKKGLVEKKITTPYLYVPTPLHLGLQLMIIESIQRFKEIQVKTKDFLRKHQADEKNELSKPKYELIMVEGRQRLMQLIKKQHKNVERNVNILTTLPRWLQILNFCFENYEKALDRGVRYQVVLEAHEDTIASHENVQALLKKQNFELRLTGSPLQTNAAIFDDNEVTVNFFPSQSLAESPLIWTNHPSFISMCQDHFDKIWKTVS